jgi:hypothetical protein
VMNVRARASFGCSVWLGALALGAVSCGSKAPDVTGLSVTVELGGVVADQLELSVTTAAGTALEPTRRPSHAGAPLASPQGVSIFLPDTLAGQDATCVVTALAAGQPTSASGAATATLVLHALVPVHVTLAPGADAGAPDAPAVDGAIDGLADGPAADEGADEGASDAPVLAPIGQTCASADQCDSSLCVDGVCCASACAGTCEACNLAGKLGTCTPLAVGTMSAGECAKQPVSGCGYDGTCDGNSGCRRYAAGAACTVGACQGASTYVPASACDGQGACVAASVVDCAPYICDATSAAPACRADCRAAGADCVTPAVCVAGSCGARPTKANGAGCSDGTDCDSKHCVDGVCCDSTCTGSCMACNQTGTAGMCRPVPAGKADPRGVCRDMGAAGCGTNATCNGAGACALYPTTTVCAAGSCSNRTLHSPKRCDGKGACQNQPDVDCAPYRCDPTATACFTSCTLSLQCAQGLGRACLKGVCL